MKIKSVRIRNFRCLRDVTLDFDDVTTLIGPNGAGKSTVLRALDWFFNGAPGQLTPDDIYAGADESDREIQVEVTFSGLTDRDREALGEKYAPAGVTTFTAWRTWREDGTDKTTGKARAFPPFEVVRAKGSAAEKRAAYNQLIEERPELGLPKWTKTEDALAAMLAWERDNPDRLEDAIVEDTHFFGFNGRNVLSGLFDFVLVTADLRAAEESLEGKRTIIGRILGKAIDRSKADAEFAELAEELEAKQAEIADRHLGGQLRSLSSALTDEVTSFTRGRQVVLRASTQEVRPSAPTIRVAVADTQVETSVDRQGHGFQRALLISALKLLADRGAAANDGSVILLAIEEPELFQHPTQAKVFSRVLRRLAMAEDGGMQVAYATHSPFFVDPRYFDQVRRITRVQAEPTALPEVRVNVASMDAVVGRLASAGVQESAVLSRWHQICTKGLADALFAEAVVLVEGEGDKAILDGIAGRDGQRYLELDGVVVAVSGGKQHLFTPHAILAELEIPTLVVFDNDSGSPQRLRERGKDGDAEDANQRATNRRLLAYLGERECDYPQGQVSATTYVFEDCLEEVLRSEWPEWEEMRLKIVADGRGTDGKNSATYELAARECSSAPRGALVEILKAARALVAPFELTA